MQQTSYLKTLIYYIKCNGKEYIASFTNILQDFRHIPIYVSQS